MISNYLKEYFKERNISQYDVEKSTGISQSKISLMLNNKRKLTAEELIKIGKVYDLDLNKLKNLVKWPQ